MPDTATVDAPAPSSAPSAPSSTPPTTTTSSTSASAPPPERLGSGASEFNLGDELDSALASPAAPAEAASPAPTAAPVIEPPPLAPPSEEPAAAAPQETAPPAEVGTPTEPAAGETLPEGVRIETRRDGSKQYVSTEAAWNALNGAQKAVLAAEELLGEPLTTERLSEMHEATVDMQGIESALLSPTPEAQYDLLRYLSDKGRVAREAGEINHDPLSHLAAHMPYFLAQTNPTAYKIQADTYLRQVLDNVYRATAGKEDPKSQSQFAAAQWLDSMAFNGYKKPGDVQAPAADPVHAQLQQLQNERAQWQQQQQAAQQQQWKNELSANYAEVKTTVGKIATDLLEPQRAAYKAAGVEKALNGLQTQMVQMVSEAIQKDENFQRVERNLIRQAQMLTSAQMRKDKLQQLTDRYAAKARIVLDPHRNAEVRAILSQGARTAVADSQANLQRATAASAQRQPTGGGTAPDRPVLPSPSQTKPGFWSNDEFREELNRLIP